MRSMQCVSSVLWSYGGCQWLFYTETVGSVVSGHLVMKEVMFCLKEKHREELNTTTKGPKSRRIKKAASSYRKRERELST